MRSLWITSFLLLWTYANPHNRRDSHVPEAIINHLRQLSGIRLNISTHHDWERLRAQVRDSLKMLGIRDIDEIELERCLRVLVNGQNLPQHTRQTLRGGRYGADDSDVSGSRPQINQNKDEANEVNVYPVPPGTSRAPRRSPPTGRFVDSERVGRANSTQNLRHDGMEEETVSEGPADGDKEGNDNVPNSNARLPLESRENGSSGRLKATALSLCGVALLYML